VREASQRRPPAGAVEQHVLHAGVAQGLELDGDLVGRAAMRASNAFCRSAAVMTTLMDRVTATLIGSNVRPRAPT
jgi:hypothetical protein